MYLKALRMRGFKSFPGSVELRFDHGIAVVVGPNGSGKSNIADALQWAMAVSSPVQLRAPTGQDVLFAGSDGRPPAGVCEVELVLDNECGTLPLEFSEVSVMRRLDRGGESEYLVNRARVRRLDVLELLSDTGLGREMHSVIGQGKVEEILLSKPHERRRFVEEAAGLGKYQRRRVRAESKLARVASELDRARDLEREVKGRLRPAGAPGDGRRAGREAGRRDRGGPDRPAHVRRAGRGRAGGQGPKPARGRHRGPDAGRGAPGRARRAPSEGRGRADRARDGPGARRACVLRLRDGPRAAGARRRRAGARPQRAGACRRHGAGRRRPACARTSTRLEGEREQAAAAAESAALEARRARRRRHRRSRRGRGDGRGGSGGDDGGPPRPGRRPGPGGHRRARGRGVGPPLGRAARRGSTSSRPAREERRSALDGGRGGRPDGGRGRHRGRGGRRRARPHAHPGRGSLPTPLRSPSATRARPRPTRAAGSTSTAPASTPSTRRSSAARGSRPAARALKAAGAELVAAGIEAHPGFERAVAAALGWRAGAVVAERIERRARPPRPGRGRGRRRPARGAGRSSRRCRRLREPARSAR